MTYIRVLPRDLFNEAKLLKCLGQLSLILHDGIGVRWAIRTEHEDSRNGFFIYKTPRDGIFCANLHYFLCKGPPLRQDEEGEDREAIAEIEVYSPANSRDNYPLRFVHDGTIGDGDESEVFTEEGKLSDEFCQWLDKLMMDT
jgi:hypothetical protein